MPSPDVPLRIEFVSRIAAVDADLWQKLSSEDHPFCRYEYLAALESSDSVGGDTGWIPQHALIYQGEQLIAAMPSYLKYHSYGEYVFDWSWAQAYERAGLEYYPKLISAIPFTPVPGPRLLAGDREDRKSLMAILFQAIEAKIKKDGLSGWHLLFPQQQLTDACATLPMLQRQDVQFHWRNNHYQSFDDFLASLRSSKRKQLRRERRIVADQGVQLQRYSGTGISPDIIDNFYLFYRQTYLRRSGHSGYLTRAFFETIASTMADQMMIAMATKEGTAIAASLFFFDSKQLYGRYWGSTEDIDCLHFEACYYQGIEFAIERKLQSFNPGTQGEHKLVRGFEPTKTQSLHWVADPRFQAALEDFMLHESAHKEEYRNLAQDHLPFKRSPSPPDTKGP